MVIGLAKADQIPIIECVGTLTEAAQICEVSREFMKYCVIFNKVSSRKSGNTILVDLHSATQYVALYKDNGNKHPTE